VQIYRTTTSIITKLSPSSWGRKCGMWWPSVIPVSAWDLLQ
jgi:hypothetical protein